VSLGLAAQPCQKRHIPGNLDLLNPSTPIFFESGYSLHTLRQASRRSWRIGQRQAVRVFYLHYEETMQSNCLRLMGRKLLVSLAMEGKFSRDGPQALDEDDDMLTAMARERVTENGVGDSAAAIWHQIQAEQQRRSCSGYHYVRTGAGCRGCAGDDATHHVGSDGRGGSQRSEVRVAPAIGSPARSTAKRARARGCAVPAVLNTRRLGAVPLFGTPFRPQVRSRSCIVNCF
jgi:hypothetical protein